MQVGPIDLTLRLPPSLHKRGSAKQLYIPPQEPLYPQLYGTTIHFYTKFLGPQGRPRTLNIDNMAKPLMDALATAFGLGANGRGDEWLQWPLVLWPHQYEGGAPFCTVRIERTSYAR